MTRRLDSSAAQTRLTGSVLRKSESPGARVGEETEAALGDANDVARMQFKRFRRRLGSLTHEQELEIENLLISTVSKISLLTESVMEAIAKNPRPKRPTQM